ncbi:hypothetical protein [Duganella qianjiadongensis]|uniref:Uncharacterized protein n=1 Tax=Duganella qianjiadongensis TaxID=2692176 RepID=A0ABW9VIX7_9BURK|nr:hypothetical protein [Duganella qianjiadongensis]MYM38986.1 hypothetical protein [Duganella qianjiadongensis]
MTISIARTFKQPPASIRSFFDRKTFAGLRSELLSTAVAPSVRNVPLYRPRATLSLFGRAKVALSGATARRERACARLNSLLPGRFEAKLVPVQVSHPDGESSQLNRSMQVAEGFKLSPKQHSKMWEVAVSKFEAAFAECKSEQQAEKMLQALSSEALEELVQTRNDAMRVAFSLDTLLVLEGAGVGLPRNNSKDFINAMTDPLGVALNREIAQRGKAAQV